MLVAGVMSGTSLDGVDVALVELQGDSEAALRWSLKHAGTMTYTAAQREAIHRAIVGGNAESLCRIHADLGEWLADAIARICQEAGIPLQEVDAVGSHGQTVWHTPPDGSARGATLQLGDAATIAERIGCTVVSDFRARDLAAGGHGAPLVPWVDQAIFRSDAGPRALQNIGGIGNVTWVPRQGDAASAFAFDTGPGNALIDAAVELGTDGSLRYDVDGRLAARGEVDDELVTELLAHPFFLQEPPKSTGRETFGRPFVDRLVEVVKPEGDDEWLSIVATLTELTARSIADACRRWLLPHGLEEMVVTGGGAFNPTLVTRIATLLHPLPVRNGTALGIDPGVKEAVAFAVLAWAHLHGIPANVPAATGAAGPRVLGSSTPGGHRQSTQNAGRV